MLNIVVFDGVCNLCEPLVRFLISKDRHGKLYFVSFQILKEMSIKISSAHDDPDSIIVFTRGKKYERSAAVLRIAALMPGFWKLLYVFVLIPRFLRDPLYRYVAENRYKWYGHKAKCTFSESSNKSRIPEKVELLKYLR